MKNRNTKKYWFFRSFGITLFLLSLCAVFVLGAAKCYRIMEKTTTGKNTEITFFR